MTDHSHAIERQNLRRYVTAWIDRQAGVDAKTLARLVAAAPAKQTLTDYEWWNIALILARSIQGGRLSMERPDAPAASDPGRVFADNLVDDLRIGEEVRERDAADTGERIGLDDLIRSHPHQPCHTEGRN